MPHQELLFFRSIVQLAAMQGDSRQRSPILELLSAIDQTTRAQAALRANLKAINLNESDLSILAMLFAMDPTPAPIGDIARQVGMSRAGMTEAINRLEKRRLVSRQHGITDRRKIHVHITAVGRAICLRGIDVAEHTLVNLRTTPVSPQRHALSH